MNKGSSGIGSASIVLIFAVLCMTIFALISLQSAHADKALSDAQERLVKSYYDADTRAEYILAEILKADAIPEKIDETNITVHSAQGTETVIAAFSCPMSDTKELYVQVALYHDSYDIQKWLIQDTGTWEIDDSLPVWQPPGASS